jgi:hypothetical protein
MDQEDLIRGSLEPYPDQVESRACPFHIEREQICPVARLQPGRGQHGEYSLADAWINVRFLNTDQAR